MVVVGLEEKIDELKIVFYAFRVAASVFAFGFLSSGLLGSEKSKETVLGVYEETSYTLSIRGDTIVYAE